MRPPGPHRRHRAARRLVTAVAGVGVAVAAALVPVVVTSATAAPAPSSDPAPDVPTGRNGDGRFTIAVIPDTQMEVLDAGDTRFTGRVQWLEQHASALDLRYITHTGDVVNWDTPDHAQYEITEPGVAALDAGPVPWSFSIGNHDTQATGVGGGARPGGDARVDQRETSVFNRYYGVDHARDLRGTFEAGKIDNSYSTFGAEHTKWLVLNLELWPRPSVVTWAQQVVASHPDFNVAVVTHAVLTADGSVQQDNGGYGATSPQYLLDHLALKYANVRFVFSGHAGLFGKADLTGVHGNPVTVLQTTYHDKTANPTRLVTIDTVYGRYASSVYAPSTGKTYDDGSQTHRTGMAWITS